MGHLQAAETEVKQVVALHHAQGRDRRIWYLLQDIIWLYIHLGDFSAAERYAQRGLEMAETLVLDKYRSVSLLYGGFVKLCRQNWSEAVNALHAVIQSTTDVYWWTEWIAHYFLGQLYRLRGQPETALDHFQKGMALFRPLSVPVAGWGNRWPLFAGLLTGLETMYEATEGDNAGFKRYCEAFELPRQSSYMPVPQQWFLKTALDVETEIGGDTAVSDSFTPLLDDEWTWHDPLGDCAFTISSGLQMQANNGRDIWQLNLSAPRLLRPIAGEFVAQTVCRPVASESPKPAIGGLLLWKDKFNFLRLVWGSRGVREFSFDGCLDNQTTVIGRGLLPQNSVTDRVLMRLTRKADTVQAFCSPDGEAWFSLGQISFPVTTSLQIGLHAVGGIDRLIYPDSYLDGTAVQFDSFSLWM